MQGQSVYQTLMSIRTLTSSFTGSLTGWIDDLRPRKTCVFLTLRDGPTSLDRLQVIVPKDAAQGLCRETYIRVTGACVMLPADKKSMKPFEFHGSSVEILGPSKPDFLLLHPDGVPLEVEVSKRDMYLRTPKYSYITRSRSHLLKSMRKAMEAMGCTEITPPSFVGTQCEGGATLFELEHPAAHGKTKAYLTQSSQFYLEKALPSQGDVYCMAPSFRAEASHTRRHLTEFLHLEAEWKDIFTLEDHMKKLIQMVQLILHYFKKYALETLKEYSALTGKDLVTRLDLLISKAHKTVHLKHQDAIEKCREFGIYKVPETKEHFSPRDDIPEAAERALVDTMDEIVLLSHFPMETKSFYMKPSPEDPTRALGVDILVPGVGEVTGSGLREGDYAKLLEQIQEQKLDPVDYAEYLALREYGFGQTSGMGLGVDRFLTWLLDLYSIREAVTFPRFPGCLRP